MSCKSTYHIHYHNGHDYVSSPPLDYYQAITRLIEHFHPHGLTTSIKRAALIMELFTQYQLDYLPLTVTKDKHLWITTTQWFTSQKSHRFLQDSYDQAPLFTEVA